MLPEGQVLLDLSVFCFWTAPLSRGRSFLEKGEALVEGDFVEERFFAEWN